MTIVAAPKASERHSLRFGVFVFLPSGSAALAALERIVLENTDFLKPNTTRATRWVSINFNSPFSKLFSKDVR
jgi:hypothetical protein